MPRAIVLAGGGAKGSFELGVWKALRELNVDFDIVIGSSVGSLNMLMMIQDKFVEALELWSNIDVFSVYRFQDETIKENINKSLSEADTYMLLIKQAIGDGSIDASPLKELVLSSIDYDKIIDSKIVGSCIVTELPLMKGHVINMKELTKEEIANYIMASCSAVPFFPAVKIGETNYIDGGFYDNLPIQSAIDLGADEILAVDLESLGNRRSYDKKVANVKTITPEWDIKGFLEFNKNNALDNIELGYLATMRLYNQHMGFTYSFNIENNRLIEVTKLFDNWHENVEILSQRKLVFTSENKKMFKENKRKKTKSDKTIRVVELLMKLNKYDPKLIYDFDEVVSELQVKYMHARLPNPDGFILLDGIINNKKVNEELEYFVLAIVKQIEEKNITIFNLLSNLSTESALMAVMIAVLRMKIIK